MAVYKAQQLWWFPRVAYSKKQVRSIKSQLELMRNQWLSSRSLKGGVQMTFKDELHNQVEQRKSSLGQERIFD